MTTNEEIPFMLEREMGVPDNVPPLAVRFYSQPRQNSKKSAQAGYPVFDDREWVEIRVPGEKQSSVDTLATDQHKQRFPKTYAAFKSRESNPDIAGMPIEQWPQITRAQAMTLRASHIHTVEALAAVHDGNLEKLGPQMRELRAKAQAFLAVAKDTAAAQKLAADSERKDMMIADLQRQIKELASRIEPERRGPGRPRKQEGEAA